MNFSGNPPSIEMFAIEGTTKTSFKIGEKVNFYCDAKGTPPLHYVWLCNDVVIDNREQHNKKLTVTAEDKSEGEYRCRVENNFGSESSKVIQIKIGEYQVTVTKAATTLEYTLAAEILLGHQLVQFYA